MEVLELKDNKKTTILMIGGLAATILIIISLVFAFSSIESKKADYLLYSNKYPNLTIIAENEGTILNGTTTIKCTNNDFKLLGEFRDNVFVSGSIIVQEKDVTYHLEGSFENFNIKDGTIKIFTKDKTIEKKGTFVDNKLEGTGSMLIKDTNTNETLFYYAGKFENDTPIY